MLITLLFSVVAKKSRTFFSFSYPANEQVCRSWEGAQPGSQPELPNGNIPYQRRQAQFSNRSWLGGRNRFFPFPWVWIFSWMGVWSSSGVSWNLQNLRFPGSAIAAWGLPVNRSSDGEKIVLYVVCFAYSLLAVVAVVAVVAVFPLLSY